MRSCKRKAKDGRKYSQRYGLKKKEDIQLIKRLVATSHFSFSQVLLHKILALPFDILFCNAPKVHWIS